MEVMHHALISIRDGSIEHWQTEDMIETQAPSIQWTTELGWVIIEHNIIQRRSGARCDRLIHDRMHMLRDSYIEMLRQI